MSIPLDMVYLTSLLEPIGGLGWIGKVGNSPSCLIPHERVCFWWNLVEV